MSEKSDSQPGGLEPQKTNLLKSSMAMASGTLISRILGFVKSALLVAAIGVTAGTAAAFNLANTLPNMVYNLLAAGVVNAILIPQIVKALKSRSGSEYVSKLLTAAGTILFGVTVAAMAATPVLITILAPTLPGPVRALTISFALICVPQIFFYGIYNLLGELLNARGIFGPYMWAPVANNVVAIVSLIVFLKLWGTAGEVLPAETFTNNQILVLAGGSTLGVIIQAAVLLVPLRNAGVSLRIDFRFKGTSFGSAPKVAGWTFATLMVSQIGVISTTNLASRGDTFTELTGEVVAGLQAYQYAFMLFMVPQSLIAVTIATAMFTRIANEVANKDFQAVADNYHRGVQLILLFSFAAVAVLLVAANQVMTMIMPGFGPTAAAQYGGVLVALMLGLPSIGLVLMSQRIFFALEDAKPVFLMGIVPTILQLIVGWGVYFLTDAQWWTAGAALGETAARLSQGFIAVVWVSMVVKQVDVRRLLGHYSKYFIAFAVSAAGGAFVNHFILAGPASPSASGRFFTAMWESVVLGLIIVFLYFAVLRVVDPEGFNDSISAVMDRLRGPKTAEDVEEQEAAEELTGSAADAPGGFSGLEADLLAESQMGETPSVSDQDEPRPLDDRRSDERSVTGHDVAGHEVEENEPSETDLVWQEILEGEGAAWALSRNLSGAEVASTGAIPILTGELPMVKGWGAKKAFPPLKSALHPTPPTPQRGTPAVAAPLPEDIAASIPPPPAHLMRVGAGAPTGSELVGDENNRGQYPERRVAHANVVGGVRRSARMDSQHSPQSTRGKSGRFNPTVPSLVLAAIVFIGGGFWAVNTAFPSNGGDLFEEFSKAASEAAGQSHQSGFGDGPEVGDVVEETTIEPGIAGIHLYSWANDEGDHPELVGHLTDGNPETVWRSRYFQNNAFAEGQEISFLVNLVEPALVTEVDMSVLGAGGEVVIRDSSDGDPRAGEILATGTLEPETVIKLAQPTEVSALGIQFLSLPTDDEGLFRAKVSNISVK